VVNAHTITFGWFLLLGGRLADLLLGRRRVCFAGTALFSCGSLLCAFASSRGLPIGAVLTVLLLLLRARASEAVVEQAVASGHEHRAEEAKAA
jgi:MFS family permease